jgi:hypothetical protein
MRHDAEVATKRRRPTSVDEEELAAFLDGRLDPESREVVAGRIAGDPEARLLLVEAARFREEETAAGRAWTKDASAVWPGRTVAAKGPGTSSPSHAAWWAATLAACLLVGLSGARDRAVSFDSDWASALTRGVEAPVLAAQVRPHGAAVLGFAAGEVEGSLPFRIGVATVDLEVGRAVGADPRVLEQIARASDTPGRTAPGGLDSAFAPDASARPYFELGRWVEASRIAAATRQAAFFEGPEFKHALGEARRGPWTEEARAELEDVDDALRKGPHDMRRLERAFEQVLRLY